MSTYTPRRTKKKTDLLPILMLVGCAVVLPLLGLVAYKVLTAPKKVAETKVITIVRSADNPNAKAINIPLGRDADAAMAAAGATDDDTPTSGKRNRNRTGKNSGGNSSGFGSASHAVDQVTSLIEESLNLPKKVLVVWLFDQSASATGLRDEVIGHLPQVYERLAKAAPSPAGDGDDDKKKLDDAPLLSFVAGFDEAIHFATEQPVSDGASVSAAAGKLKASSGHVEKTFAAVRAAAERAVEYRKKKGRVVMIVLVTDEAGDDRATIDETLPKLTGVGIPVQLIGPSAVFGRSEGSNIGAEGESKDGQLNVVQGPDSRDPELVLLDSARYSGEANVDTGLAPYHLARLTKETGGAFFSTTGREVPAALKGFEPEYVSENTYAEQLKANKAKAALVAAAKLPRAAIQSSFHTSFTASDDAKKAREISDAQKPAAKVRPAIDALYAELKKGEPDVAKLVGTNDRRWRAAFELAIGRAGAAKARHDGYIDMSAQLRSGKTFKNAGSTVWTLEPSDEPMGISVDDKLAAKSRDYLQHVVKEYPGTPWAAAAEAELQTPFGWKWTER